MEDNTGLSSAPGTVVHTRDLWVAGFLATGLALSVLWVAAAFASQAVPFAPASLADALIRATPGDISSFFIDLLKHWAIRLLALGVMAATLVFGGAALSFSARRSDRPRSGLAGIALAVLAAVAIVLGPGNKEDPAAMIIVLGGTAFVYARAARYFYVRFTDTAASAYDPSRRRALRMGVGGAAGLALAGGAIGWAIKRLGGPDRNVALVTPEVAATIPDREPFPNIPGLSPEITSPEDHYVVDINFVQPTVEAEGWAVKVTGLVAAPAEYDFASLQNSFPVVEEYVVLTCISNEIGGDLVGNSLWGGVRLADVLAAAGPLDGAVDVIFRAADGYTDSIPIEVAMDPSVLLAVSQNREPLQQEHGFPCRVRIPKIYGMKNVKWLEEIEVVNEDYLGYWMQRGWSDEAIVHTGSRIDVAGADKRAARGDETWIAGVAWAGDRGISKVEVSTDGAETWSEAMLKEPLSPYSWTQWALRWTPDRKGIATCVVRATDGDGEVQTAQTASPHPAGATGWHRVDVSVS